MLSHDERNRDDRSVDAGASPLDRSPPGGRRRHRSYDCSAHRGNARPRTRPLRCGGGVAAALVLHVLPKQCDATRYRPRWASKPGDFPASDSAAPSHGGRPSRQNHGRAPGLRAGQANRRGCRYYAKDGANRVARRADHAPYHREQWSDRRGRGLRCRLSGRHHTW